MNSAYFNITNDPIIIPVNEIIAHTMILDFMMTESKYLFFEMKNTLEPFIPKFKKVSNIVGKRITIL